MLVFQWGVASVNITGLFWSELADEVSTVLWLEIWTGFLIQAEIIKVTEQFEQQHV